MGFGKTNFSKNIGGGGGNTTVIEVIKTGVVAPSSKLCAIKHVSCSTVSQTKCSLDYTTTEGGE